MEFERNKDVKQSLGIGQYIYDNGFGPRNYVCTGCNSTKLERKHPGGFSPCYYICHDCGKTVYSPKWINLD